MVHGEPRRRRGLSTSADDRDRRFLLPTATFAGEGTRVRREGGRRSLLRGGGARALRRRRTTDGRSAQKGLF